MADARIPLDAQRIAQAVLELARNAVKFSRPGKTIGIGSATDGEIVRFWVRDEGRGIPADQLDAVVERFGRADARGVEGSGLGLAIVSSIVDAHGGRLVIASTPGVGSTVTIELPCRSAADELPDGSESPSREGAPWVTS